MTKIRLGLYYSDLQEMKNKTNMFVFSVLFYPKYRMLIKYKIFIPDVCQALLKSKYYFYLGTAIICSYNTIQ